jgi:hypothetical protein
MLKSNSVMPVVVASMLALPLVLSGQVATPSMIGRWEGEAAITVDWTRQRTIGVNIVIFAVDKVTGAVGDAKLVNGRLLKGRGWPSGIMRKTDYVIDGYLDGPIIQAERIERANVGLALDWRDGRLEGVINTSGWKSGGAERAVLAATVTLHRAPDMIICETTTSCRGRPVP